eukprot:comp4717_c0_seq1/m.876 comp4717_c0_seq1/g.876  ORF comp4717_c0_seq1/g.876 comp4717_c0_seq1/m.876 type:complete len:320 (-) comp4717_c0_seq1:384-1343(-)
MDDITLCIKWSGSEYNITVPKAHTVEELKGAIQEKTGVQAHRQKLLGLKYKGKPPADNVKLVDLDLKPGMKIMMMGTREEFIVEDVPEGFDDAEVINDLDWSEETVAVRDREENLAKVQKRVQMYKFNVLNPPRPGKKLLVLDVDYTLFDHRSIVESPLQLMRPYLHEFLTAAYEHYDIVIWSATSMKWVEVKMKELGVLGHSNYKISFFMDHLAMITVQCPKYGVINTKPLGVVWGAFPGQYTPENTIMFDDLKRNFIMNPQNGLKIKPFKNAPVNRDTDDTLRRLTEYLLFLASHQSLSSFDHDDWKSTMRRQRDRP